MLGVIYLNDALAIRSEIIRYGCDLLDHGLIVGTWGNLSARIPNTCWIAITPSGRNYRTLSPEDVVIVDMDGKLVEGNLKPSSELALHLAIYRARADISAVIHTHSIFASACAVARQAIPAIVEDLVQVVGGSVDVAEYALMGTGELAENTVRALGKKNAVLLANHGVVGCGSNLNEAMTACQLVEKTAQIYIYANQIGGAKVLSDKDVTIMHKGYMEHYRMLQGGAS